MRKKKFNALLASLLVFSMAFSQPAAVLAEENVTVADNEDNSSAVTEDENETDGALTGDESTPETGSDDAQTSAGGGDSQTGNENGEDSQSPGEEDGSQSGSENGEDIQNPDDGDGSQAGNENGEDSEDTNAPEEGDDAKSNEDEIIDDNLKAEAQRNGLSVDSQKKLNDLGFKTMSLNQAMRTEKAALTQVVSTMSMMKPDEDYIEGELVYLADSEEDARKVAECYGGTLSEYNYGVAVADIEQPVEDAVKVAADVSIPIPAVYPNIIYTIAGEWDSSSVDTSDITISEVSQEETQEETTDSEETEAAAPEEKQDEAQAATDASYTVDWHHANIHTKDAWGTSDESKGKGVTVAVLDTGIDYEHPDLQGNIAGHISMVHKENSTTVKDVDGHGTHCAGIIAAVENNIGGVGVAPMASIYSIQVLDDEGSGVTADIIAGLAAALTQNVDVISMSLGSHYYDALYQKAIDKVTKKGIVVIAAAGNGDDTHRVEDGHILVNGVPQKEYPAAYNNVIAVAATDADNYLTYFSNYGDWVDIAAPGYKISSTLPNGNYGEESGTSMACPIVAGTVALMLANNKDLRDTNTIACVNRIKNDLLASANPTGAKSYYYLVKNEYYNWGYDHNRYYPLLNVAEAVYTQVTAPLEAPEITFASPAADAKNVVKVENNTKFTLTAKSEHDKIYYTTNGKKPTPATGYRYNGPVSVQNYSSGKVKIQAIAVRGSRTSKVLSKTFTLNFAVSGVYPSGVTYTSNEAGLPEAAMNVSIGKSIQLAVDVEPFNASNKKITWTCNDEKNWIKVNKSGKVTCNKNATAGHSVVVTAESQDESKKKCQFVVTVVSGLVSSLTLDKQELTMSYWDDSEDGSGVLFGDTKYEYYHKLVVTSAGASNNQYLYKSSNTKVATVDANGGIRAQAKGKAKITVTANDGSGKKAVCNVTVVTPVFDIFYLSSTGYYGGTEYSTRTIPIAAGCSINMKTWVNYSDQKYTGFYKTLLAPSNKTLEWTSANSSSITAKNGKITCSKTATPGADINVTISAKKGYGYRESVTVTFHVVEKIDKIYMADAAGKEAGSGLAWSTAKVGDMIGDPMYATTVTRGTSKSIMRLMVKTSSGKTYPLSDYMKNNEQYNLVRMDFSNKDVVQNIYYWERNILGELTGNAAYCLVARKPGSAKINYVLNDGSKKKFTISVKVSK